MPKNKHWQTPPPDSRAGGAPASPELHSNLAPVYVAAKVDNLVTARKRTSRPKSLLRDAAFERAIEEIRAAEAVAIGAGTLVSSKELSNPSSSTSPSTAPSSTTTTIPSTKRRRRTELPCHKPWLNQAPVRKHRTPAQWRDARDETKLQWYHQALLAQGPTHAFSANLRSDVEAQALIEPSAVQWLAARIAKHAKDALDRLFEFYLVVEQDEGRLHLHGEGQFSADEAERVRKALRLACGEVAKDKTRQRQTHTDPNPDEGWAAYIGKDLYKASAFMRRVAGKNRFWGVTYKGDPVSVTKKTASLAKQLYNSDRDKVIAAGGIKGKWQNEEE